MTDLEIRTPAYTARVDRERLLADVVAADVIRLNDIMHLDHPDGRGLGGVPRGARGAP